MDNKIYYFTFGGGHPLHGYCQPISGHNWLDTREVMVNIYGTRWAFQYTEEEWFRIREDIREKLLPLIGV
jgi:hypothetical protein